MPAPKPPGFRRRALDLVAVGGPVAEVARNLGSASRVCVAGIIQADVVSEAREIPSGQERRELVELRRKNRVLETEMEIMKRASSKTDGAARSGTDVGGHHVRGRLTTVNRSNLRNLHRQ
jgi:transposase